jgi:DNA-binding transcriptional LysR family regulator
MNEDETLEVATCQEGRESEFCRSRFKAFRVRGCVVMSESIASISGLSLDRLITLCSVAEAGSIAEAAGGDANRQSQFSRQIGELEGWFGTTLLERSSRPYRLNAVGRRLAASTRLYLRELEALREEAAGKELRVVVGAGESLIQGLLLPAGEKVRTKQAGVRFAFRNLASEDVLSQLMTGEIDLGFLRSEEVSPAFTTSSAWTYEYEAWVPFSLNSAKGVLKTADLGSMPWAVLEGKGHFRQFLENRALANKSPLNIGVECSSYAQIECAVLSGRYAGFLPSFHRVEGKAEAKLMRRRPEPALRYERTVVMAWLPRLVESRVGFGNVLHRFQKIMTAAGGLRPLLQI